MSYLKNRTLDESLNIIRVLSSTCAEKGGPIAKELNSWLLEGRFKEIVEFSFDYSTSTDSDDFIYARQIQSLLNKQDFIDLGYDKKGRAVELFQLSEQICRESNARLELNLPGNPDVAAVLYGAQRKIGKILGDAPTIDSLDLKFGPGATTSTKSETLNNRLKLSSRLECSMNLVPKLGLLLEELPLIAEHNARFADEDRWIVDVAVVPGELIFVPKNCKVYRSIVKEPVLNGLIQKGIGSLMKSLLKSSGLDLYQQDRNRKLAQKGAVTGTLATVDFSMCSDTICRNVVWNLIRYDWAELLDCCRSDCVSYNGETIRLEKFSSMGNAYTFELESLLLFGLAYSTCRHLGIDTSDISVFGDDVIIPVDAMSLFREVTQYCGFIINIDKSYCDGPFRESCGADYLGGIDIRPFYLKTKINDRVLFSMHNWFVRSCEFDLAKIVLTFIHPHNVLWGPDGYGDGHLIGDFVLRSSRTLKRNGWSGGVFDSFSLKPRMCCKAFPGDWVYPMYSIYVKGNPKEFGSPDTGDIVRGTNGYCRMSIYTLATSIFEVTRSADTRQLAF